ncbi:MAG: hypothetical protein IBX70_06525 [Clostridia bacterium]|nr:hypothetical protein [Clostridia bacterium]
MFEKIKDFFYDISDIFVSLLIIALIFISVSWKISDTLSIDIDAPITSEIDQEQVNDPPVIIVTPEKPEDPEDPVEETPEDPDIVAEPVTPVDLKTFTVSEGSTGYSIGQKLQSEGYVDDVNSFVKRLIEMGYDSKLRAGDFKISTSDDLDTIIKVLAGQRR